MDEAADDYEVTTVSFYNYISTITPFMSIAEVDSDAMAKHLEIIAAFSFSFEKYFCAKMEL
ncbi:MAG: hypothetical protein KVP17_004109 [Porospora cf. gigantea B]|nr:MAG: hypothetical protein KVP17_004109 [Porospora cf. gigantea B]